MFYNLIKVTFGKGATTCRYIYIYRYIHPFTFIFSDVQKFKLSHKKFRESNTSKITKKNTYNVSAVFMWAVYEDRKYLYIKGSLT